MGANQITIKDLQPTPVDTQSPVPLYYQVEADLRALMGSDLVAVGDLLPTELELAKAYKVGRHTIRTALSRLVNDDLIVRKAGHGTVVKGRVDRRLFSLTRSFTSQMAEMGLQARSKVLGAASAVLGDDSPPELRGKIGAPYFDLSRLRFGGAEPVGLQHSFVITELCPDLQKFDFNVRSLYDVLSTHYQLVIARITHTISAVVAAREQAKWLQVAAGDPLLLVKTCAYLENAQIIEFTISHYRADKYEYRTTHTNIG
jgi:GntR family transcriptional regulator